MTFIICYEKLSKFQEEVVRKMCYLFDIVNNLTSPYNPAMNIVKGLTY